MAMLFSLDGQHGKNYEIPSARLWRTMPMIRHGRDGLELFYSGLLPLFMPKSDHGLKSRSCFLPD